MADFFRFGVKFVEELYAQQPPKNAPNVWKLALHRLMTLAHILITSWTVASNIVHWKVLSSLSPHSTLRPLVATFPVVSIIYTFPIDYFSLPF
jgi:hypothetical protein